MALCSMTAPISCPLATNWQRRRYHVYGREARATLTADAIDEGWKPFVTPRNWRRTAAQSVGRDRAGTRTDGAMFIDGLAFGCGECPEIGGIGTGSI
jgi:hypothetical protein